MEMNMKAVSELPNVVIVGRPNVGKSSLFNCLCGKRISIVHSESGVTRDRITCDIERDEHAFRLIDTGGILFFDEQKKNAYSHFDIREQVDAAIDSADLVVLALDFTSGQPTPLDNEIYSMLRKKNKKTLVLINKVDNDNMERDASDFFPQSKDCVPVSCAQRRGIAESMDRIVSMLPKKVSLPAQKRVSIAIIGRPNVGKSSIVNRLLGSERMIVSEIPGTTRDCVDIEVDLENDGKILPALLVDTAGLRQKRRADSAVEIFSIMRTENAIKRADIVVFVAEASTGEASAQDKKVASLIAEYSKPCLILINKSDLASEKRELEALDEAFSSSLPFLPYAMVMPCSAKSGFGIKKISAALARISEDMRTVLPTALVNKLIMKAYERNRPPSDGRRIFKLYYATMVNHGAPLFIIFANYPDLCKPNYVNYLKNFLRNELGLVGTPIRIQFRKRERPGEGRKKKENT